LTFVRGPEAEAATRTSIDWARLAPLDGTLVCYAGPHQAPIVLSALLAHGRPADDGAAIVYDGTLPTQQTQSGSLQEMSEAAKRSGDRPPAGVVVGRVAEAGRHLRWFELAAL